MGSMEALTDELRKREEREVPGASRRATRRTIKG